MQALSDPPAVAVDEPDDGAAADDVLEFPPAVGAGPLVFPPPLLLLPHADNASVTAATPAITALVRRPRTMNVLSKTGALMSPALSYLRHGIHARNSRKGLGHPIAMFVTRSLRDPSHVDARFTCAA
jgi:hypothetical protein